MFILSVWVVRHIAYAWMSCDGDEERKPEQQVVVSYMPDLDRWDLLVNLTELYALSVSFVPEQHL